MNLFADIGEFFGALLAKLFSKSDRKEAYDQGVKQGKTGDRYVMEKAVADAARDSKNINDDVRKRSDDAVADELRKWNRPGQ